MDFCHNQVTIYKLVFPKPQSPANQGGQELTSLRMEFDTDNRNALPCKANELECACCTQETNREQGQGSEQPGRGYLADNGSTLDSCCSRPANRTAWLLYQILGLRLYLKFQEQNTFLGGLHTDCDLNST